MSNTALLAKGISKVFTRPVTNRLFSGIDLEVMEGESLAIMGRSGQGKSTLLHILGTLETPTEGTLSIFGEKCSFWNRAALRSSMLGFIFQSFHLLNDFTVFENIAMPARIARRPCGPKSELYDRLQNLLELVGLAHRSNHQAKLLSGGEKQRVAIARALCNDPAILFADEPSGNLDQQTAEGIHQLLIDLVQKEKKTLIVVTHNEQLARLCGRRCLIEEGVIKDGNLS